MPWDTSTRRSRLPKDWATTRRRILHRDAGRCTAQPHAPGCTGQATDVDHITPGDNHTDANLTSLSTACHKAKTQQEAQRARAQRPGYTRTPEAHPGLTR